MYHKRRLASAPPASHQPEPATDADWTGSTLSDTLKLLSSQSLTREPVPFSLFHRLSKQWLEDREVAERKIEALRAQVNGKEKAFMEESRKLISQLRELQTSKTDTDDQLLHSGEKLVKVAKEREVLRKQLEEEISANKVLTRAKARLELAVSRLREGKASPEKEATAGDQQPPEGEQTPEIDEEAYHARAMQEAHEHCHHQESKAHSDVIEKLEFELATARETIHALHSQLLKKTEELSRQEAARCRQGSVDPPTGRVVIAFTDVQGSTALWEKNPEAMRLALELHFKVLRQSLAAVAGYEVKTEGDAMMCVFKTSAQALWWACHVQEAMLAADWSQLILKDENTKEVWDGTLLFRGLRVRIGFHVGAPYATPDAVTSRMDYFGRTVNKAARIANIGHGGQVLMSGEVWDEIEKSVPAYSIVDLGEVSLKGIQDKVHIFQVLPKSLQCRKFPPLRIQQDGMTGDKLVSQAPADPFSSGALRSAEKVLDEINSCPTSHEGGMFLCSYVKELRKKALDSLEDFNQEKSELCRLKALTAEFEDLEQHCSTEDALSQCGEIDEVVALQRYCSALKSRIVRMDVEFQRQTERLAHVEEERSALMRLMPNDPLANISEDHHGAGEQERGQGTSHPPPKASVSEVEADTGFGSASWSPAQQREYSRSDLIHLSERTLAAEHDAHQMGSQVKEMSAALEAAKREAERLKERLWMIEGRQSARLPTYNPGRGRSSSAAPSSTASTTSSREVPEDIASADIVSESPDRGTVQAAPRRPSFKAATPHAKVTSASRGRLSPSIQSAAASPPAAGRGARPQSATGKEEASPSPASRPPTAGATTPSPRPPSQQGRPRATSATPEAPTEEKNRAYQRPVLMPSVKTVSLELEPGSTT